ncbi:MAG: TPM domain-containing protein [Bacteroidetes bacterium]|nr:TPM domain-containing protein [Bacteroidota bacterium]
MNKLKFLLFCLLLPFLGRSQQFPEKPNPPRLVNDFTNTLNDQEKNALEQKLLIYNDSTSTQIAIVMIRSLDGYPADDYAIQLAEKWGIGQKGTNNGVLIFIAKDDRKIFIPTGYGMEGVMPDGLVKRIIENDIKPSFREGKYYEGLDRATDSMFRLAAGEYKAEPKKKQKESPPLAFIIGILLFISLFLWMKVRSVKQYSLVNNITFWAAWALLNQATRTHRGSWGGFSGGGGSSWGGGSSGGGFGGFGGGSFGGGGAGGSW